MLKLFFSVFFIVTVFRRSFFAKGSGQSEQPAVTHRPKQLSIDEATTAVSNPRYRRSAESEIARNRVIYRDAGFNECVEDETDYGGRLVHTVSVTEIKICNDLCVTYRVCNTSIFKSTPDVNGLHTCWLKFSAGNDRRPGPNLKATRISCTRNGVRCFSFGVYNTGGDKYIKRRTTVRECYAYCLQKGSDCKVFEYDIKTRKCTTASEWNGSLVTNSDYVSGFPSCDPGLTTQEEINEILDVAWFPTS